MLSVVASDPHAPCPAPFNMAAYVLDAGPPDKIALYVLGDQDWSYRALRAAVRGTATGLHKAGAVPGDLILMRLGNTVDFPIAYLGALAAGMVPVPTAAGLTLPEVAKIIADLSPRLILHDPDVACPEAKQVISRQQLKDMRSLPATPYHMGDPNRLGYVIYTSGTSGQPRAVAHAHRAIWARQMMFKGWYDLHPEDRMLHTGAFNWTYTLGTGLMDPWTIGATALIPAGGTHARDLPDLLKDHHATLFAAAPGVYRKILKHHDHMNLPRLRHGLSAGEKLAPRIAQAWTAATGTQIYEAYGLSECSTFLSSSPAHPAKADSLGRPQPGRRVAIINDGPAPRGVEGTIAIHTSDPGLMLGYLNAPDEMAAKHKGEWFLTGDQGIMDPDGHITYMGRADDMMNAGGFRVSPIEVEQALSDFEGLTGVAATQVEIKLDTFVIAAFYTGPKALDERALRSYVSDKLAPYKQPRLYVHMDALPIGTNGKLLRRQLRDTWKAQHA